jgi:hypothetical protein
MKEGVKNIRDRLTAQTERRFSQGSGSYSISSAARVKILKKFLGPWAVREHLEGGGPYAKRFAARIVKDVPVEGLTYVSDYDFQDTLCVKHVEITGTLQSDEGTLEYRYRMVVALVWDIAGPEQLVLQPRLGYQYTTLGREVVAFKELEENKSQSVFTNFKFQEDSLILEEGEDYKRLERIV